MSRFSYDDGEGVPWPLWERAVTLALGGRRGQDALAALEKALLALPERKLIEGHLAADGGVCTVGAFVAQARADAEGVDLPTIIEKMSAEALCWCGHGRRLHRGACAGRRWNGEPCRCTEFSLDEPDVMETVDAGYHFGLPGTIAWHLAYLNDEQFERATPEQRYERVLTWVQRALGRKVVTDGA